MTYSACWFALSLYILMMKSPDSFGSKVDGTMTYSPGGSLWWSETSRRLLKAEDFAEEVFLSKKLLSRVPLLVGGAWKENYQEIIKRQQW